MCILIIYRILYNALCTGWSQINKSYILVEGRNGHDFNESLLRGFAGYGIPPIKRKAQGSPRKCLWKFEEVLCVVRASEHPKSQVPYRAKPGCSLHSTNYWAMCAKEILRVDISQGKEHSRSAISEHFLNHYSSGSKHLILHNFVLCFNKYIHVALLFVLIIYLSKN